MIINSCFLFICISIFPIYRGSKISSSIVGLTVGSASFMSYLLCLISFLPFFKLHAWVSYFECHLQNFQCPIHAPHIILIYLKLKFTHGSVEDSDMLLLKGEKGKIHLCCPHALLGIPVNALSWIFIVFVFFSIPVEKWVFAVLSRKRSASYFRTMHVLSLFFF